MGHGGRGQFVLPRPSPSCCSPCNAFKCTGWQVKEDEEEDGGARHGLVEAVGEACLVSAACTACRSRGAADGVLQRPCAGSRPFVHELWGSPHWRGADPRA